MLRAAVTPLLLLAGLPGADRLEQRLETGDRLRTTVESRQVAELVRSVVRVDGEEVGGEQSTRRTTTTAIEVEFVDHHRAVTAGRLVGVDRTYDRARRESSMAMVEPSGRERTSDSVRASALAGVELRFDRADGGSFVASTGAGDDREVLAGPRLTPDWSRLLPPEAVAVGDTWELPIELLSEWREPGGDIDWRQGGDPARDRELVAPPGSTAIEGALTATLASVSDGLAAVTLELEATTRLDLTPFLPPADPEVEHGDEAHRPVIQSVVIDTDWTGAGQLLWSLDRGRLQSLDLRLDGTERETVDFGHTQLAPGRGAAPHDVKLEAFSESTVTEHIVVALDDA